MVRLFGLFVVVLLVVRRGFSVVVVVVRRPMSFSSSCSSSSSFRFGGFGFCLAGEDFFSTQHRMELDGQLQVAMNLVVIYRARLKGFSQVW